MQSFKRRFDFLDGVRGLAALFVMFYHYTQHNGLIFFKGAWIAVDLFFILSGFVLSYGYGAKIIDGMSFRDFFRIRLIRLAPLYFVGFLLGLAFYVVASLQNGLIGLNGELLVAASILNLFGLPYVNNEVWPFGDDHIVGAAFPLNDPAWSLFFEIVVNIFFMFTLLNLRNFRVFVLFLFH